ncbi:hypothetical protein O6H91_06G057600 [Diphasiastrum complanatum]|uniref:Uncharacterized protein n=1 Tax=Diphasiastrum complanatum TaxID=34168 RepID=A0ACC2DDZ5_DIPCM|nr:hypothetical protein O6H91_06G057600 [Diphasiastrum complanatum]
MEVMDIECLCRVAGYQFPEIDRTTWDCPMVDIPVVDIPAIDPECLCPICMYPVIPDPTPEEVDSILKLRCGHMIHLSCFWDWFESNTAIHDCPLCRRSFSSQLLSDLKMRPTLCAAAS